MIAPVSSTTPIRFNPLSSNGTPASEPSPFDKPRGPTSISISREAFEALKALEQGHVVEPEDPLTYDKKVKALLAARQEVVERGGINLGDTSHPLIANPYAAPFAGHVAPLYGMIEDGAEASQALSAALTSVLPQQGQRSDTTYAAEFALKYMKMTAIADRMVVPEKQKEATAILGRVFDMLADTVPIEADLGASTLAIARGSGDADTRATQIITLVNKALDHSPQQNSLTDRQRYELTEMMASWKDFQKLLPPKATSS